MPRRINHNLINQEELGCFQRIVYRNINIQRKKSPVPYPGRRFLARLLDWTIYYLIWNYISLIMLRGKLIKGLLLIYLDSMAVMVVMFLLEPLFISLFRATPGKFIMGLSLSTDEGERLKIQASLRRTLQLFADGLGFNIIIFNILNMVRARRNAAEGRALLWEQENSYKIEDTANWRMIIAVLLILLLLLYGLPPIYNLAQYPLHRGDINKSQYIENVNEMLWRSGEKSGFKLDEEGNWLDKEGQLLSEAENLPPRHEIIEKDGKVEAVKLKIVIDVPGKINGGLDQKALVAAAFAAANENIQMQDLQSISAAIGDIANSFEFSVKDLIIECHVSYFGYRADKNLLYGEEENSERFYDCDFSVLIK